ncbi:ABC transporter [Fusarium heterosporum]|uniref:ABC transporter n=1 Tax=Fusarium heterosporum TaxID=42747 RepID=A0A8H5WQ36_FUSHE|nr:ABC transporter [Fusarium heterosporum]
MPLLLPSPAGDVESLAVRFEQHIAANKSDADAIELILKHLRRITQDVTVQKNNSITHETQQRDMLRVIVQAFDRTFLRGENIHVAVQRLDMPTLSQRDVIQSYYAAVAASGLPIAQQSSTLLGPQHFSSSLKSVYAIFGGQGIGGSYLDELRSLFKTYRTLIEGTLKSSEKLLLHLSHEADTPETYADGLFIMSWLESDENSQSKEYLNFAPVSFPLIGLLQLVNYEVTCRTLGLHPGQLQSSLSGTTGHSQGLVTAAAISMADSWESWEKSTRIAITALFWLGLRTQQAYDPVTISPAVLKDSDKHGEGVPTCMLHLRGFEKENIVSAIIKTNKNLHSDSRLALSLVNGPDNFVVSGSPIGLYGLNRHLRKMRQQGQRTSRYLSVSAPFHNQCLAKVSEIFHKDLDGLMFHSCDLKTPLFCTRTGINLAASGGDIMPQILRLILSDPLDWEAATAFPGATHIIDFGPGGVNGIGIWPKGRSGVSPIRLYTPLRRCLLRIAARERISRACALADQSVQDLPALDSKLASSTVQEALLVKWDKYDKSTRHSLLRASFRAFWPSLILAVVPRLCLTVFNFTQPFLVEATVKYIGQPSSSASYANGLIGAWALVFIGLAVTNSIYQYQLSRFIARFRGSLIGLIYQQTLQARAADLGQVTAISLVGADVERIAMAMSFVHEAWGCILDISVAIWLLERQLLIACVAPALVIIILLAITAPLGPMMKTAQLQWIQKVQERLRVTTAMLENMKAVKMLGLSDVMSSIIDKARKNEIASSAAFRKILVLQLIASNAPVNMAPVVTFAVYVIIAVFWKNESLLAAQGFTSLTLINLLTTPTLLFIQAFPTLIRSIACFDRIQEYCNYTKMSARQTLKDHDGRPRDFNTSEKQSVINVHARSISWASSKPAVLHDVDINVTKASLTVIAGSVGSGKSTLLNSMLGETVTHNTLSHSQHQISPVAYCAQEPWLETGTIRSNIIGVYPYEPQWYATVRHACGLDPDIQQMKKGDQNPVASRGTNLSGGQRQRVALARAVYSRRRIIILDDVFSGMDAHTAEFVSRQLLGRHGLLRRKTTTVILATHNDKLMAMADVLIVLKDQKVLATGSPEAAQSDGHIMQLGPNDPENGTVEGVAQVHVETPLDRATPSLEQSMRSSSESEIEAKDDDPRRKQGDVSVYKYYLSSSGLFTTLAFAAFTMASVFCTEFPAIWLKWWAEANAKQPNQNVGMYMGVFAAVGISGVLVTGFACWFAFIRIISNSALHLHSALLETTINAPFQYFVAVDTGSLINRFSQDLELIDMNLPMVMINFTLALFSSLAKLIILAVFSRYLSAAVPVFVLALYFLQRFYLQTSRQVRLLDIEAKAPLYNHILETVAGASTIRAFGWQAEYAERNFQHTDTSQRVSYMQESVQNWLSFVLDIIVAILAVALVGMVVTWPQLFDAGSVGVSLIMLISFSNLLTRLLKAWTSMESSIGAVSRVKRFVADTESEYDPRTDKGTNMAQGWPVNGKISLEDIFASHKPNTGPVLKGIALSINAGEHIAICGRTGSGKSSLILSLLRMLDIDGGNILIDDFDISNAGVTDLRARINAVPQDPFFIPGTIRLNLDPFQAASDDDIAVVLHKIGLSSIIQASGGLNEELDTAAWSAGQKQLLCLARAMLRKSKILILDEAMSNVDSVTEAKMQEIIDTDFEGCTVISVMHRLAYAQNYDKLALLDDGKLVAFDKPERLLSSTGKMEDLYKMKAQD